MAGGTRGRGGISGRLPEVPTTVVDIGCTAFPCRVACVTSPEGTGFWQEVGETILLVRL